MITTTVSSVTRAQKMDSRTVVYYITGVITCPTLRGVKHFPNTSYFFLMLGVYTLSTYFLLHKSNTDKTQTPKQCTNNYCS